MAEIGTPRTGEVVAVGPHGLFRVAYVEWGPEKAERTVLCVHGLTRVSRDFDYLALRLANKGIRVICPDLPGRGKSQWLENPEDYATPVYVAAMAAVIARAGVDEIDWVGTSLGGHVGMEFAALAGAPVRRLVLNDFGARVSAPSLQRMGSYLRLKRTFETVEELEGHLRSIHAPFGNLTDAQWRHLAVHSAVKAEDGRIRQHYDPGIGRMFSWPLMLDIALWHVWDKVSCPVLILHGSESDLLHTDTVREMQKRGAAGKKGKVRAIEVRGVGHAPQLMASYQIALIEEFLTSDRGGVKTTRGGAIDDEAA